MKRRGLVRGFARRVYRAARSFVLNRVSVEVELEEVATIRVSTGEAGEFEVRHPAGVALVRSRGWEPARFMCARLQWVIDRQASESP